MINMNEKIIENKDLKTKNYSDFYTTTVGKTILEKEIAIINKELSGCKRVLSLGCGPAVHEIKLSEMNPNMEIICLDPSDLMIQESKLISNNTKLLQGYAEQLPLKNAMFDCAYFLTSLEFIEDINKALKETSRILKPRGKILFLISNLDSWYFQKEYFEKDSFFKRNIKHINNQELKKKICERFNVISVCYELGIHDKEVFNTNNQKWASLNVIITKKWRGNN